MSTPARIARRIDDQHIISIAVLYDGYPTAILKSLSAAIDRDGAVAAVTATLDHCWVQFCSAEGLSAICDNGVLVPGYGETLDSGSPRISLAPSGQHPSPGGVWVSWTYLISEDLKTVEVWDDKLVGTYEIAALGLLDLVGIECGEKYERCCHYANEHDASAPAGVAMSTWTSGSQNVA